MGHHGLTIRIPICGWSREQAHMNDVVTFTITLPVAAPFDEYVSALKAGTEAQARIGNPGAAQALLTIRILAERGLLAFNTDVKYPHIMREA
jgi:hypothetical protein